MTFICILLFEHFLPQDIKTIAHSLSNTMKNNIPYTEFGPGQQDDVSAVLFMVEDFIKQNNKASETSELKSQGRHNLFRPELPGVYLL